MKKLTLLTSSLSSVMLLAASAHADVLFVSADLASGSNDGTSWSDAFQGSQGLQSAIAAAVYGDQIYVAQGLYTPTAGFDRTASFQWRGGIQIYGGFLGTESSPFERPQRGGAPTILSGDLQGNDASFQFEDNSYHVVEAVGTDFGSMLDGFTIQSGNANGSAISKGGGLYSDQVTALILRDCEFRENSATDGGGAYLSALSVDVKGCSFISNKSTKGGGVLVDSASTCLITRSHFLDNFAFSMGGAGVYVSQSDRVVVKHSLVVRNHSLLGSFGPGTGIFLDNVADGKVLNCTIVGNDPFSVSPVSQGYGIFSSNSTTEVTNCIVSGNGPSTVQNPAGQIGGTTWTYSLVDGSAAGLGNISAAPLFLAPGIDYALVATSPGVDAGINAAVGASDYSLNNGRRFVDSVHAPDTGVGSGPIVDMGAYEYDAMKARYDCLALSNSTGLSSLIHASGSTQISHNQLILSASALPLNQFGYFLGSRTAGFTPFPGASQGFLCLSGALVRFNQVGQLRTSGASGAFTHTFRPGTLPGSQGSFSAVAGETWYFQAWFRDGDAGIGVSNFTDRVAVEFE